MRTMVMALAVSVALAGSASAQFSQNRDTIRARTNDRNVRQILSQIRTDTDSLRRAVESRGRVGAVRRAADDDVYYLISDLQQSTDHLVDHLDRNQVIQAD